MIWLLQSVWCFLPVSDNGRQSKDGELIFFNFFVARLFECELHRAAVISHIFSPRKPVCHPLAKWRRPPEDETWFSVLLSNPFDRWPPLGHFGVNYLAYRSSSGPLWCWEMRAALNNFPHSHPSIWYSSHSNLWPSNHRPAPLTLYCRDAPI